MVIAEIIRPHGNRGEVVVRAQSDVPGRLENLKDATARLSEVSAVSRLSRDDSTVLTPPPGVK